MSQHPSGYSARCIAREGGTPDGGIARTQHGTTPWGSPATESARSGRFGAVEAGAGHGPEGDRTVYSRRMTGESEIEARDGRRQELMAEAQAAVAYSANSLKSVRERYREGHQGQVGHWDELRDELNDADRRAVATPTEHFADEAPHAATDKGAATSDGAEVAAEAGAADARMRVLRRDEAIAARTAGAEAAELARLDLALKSLESVWLFLSRDDASLISEPGDAISATDIQMRIVEAQEAERTRLAREVHDGPAQALSNATFQVEIVERNLARDPALAAAELRLLRDLLRRELSDVRAFISQLRPPILADVGLSGAIREAADQVAGITGVPIKVEVDGAIDDLPETAETVILRIIQEALQNVRRHAQAQHVMIKADREPDGWSIEVRDDGRGFDVGVVAARGRRNFGLQFMRERAELIGARFEVRSRPDGGTVVRITVPRGAEETT
jgi:two-component system sensor histidine kinase DegS